MKSLPRMVTVTPSRVSFTSAALQRLEAVNHGFDARTGDAGFLHQPRVLFVQVVLLGLERVVLALETPAGLDGFTNAAFQNLEIRAFRAIVVSHMCPL